MNVCDSSAYVLNLNYPNPRVANSGQYTAADDSVFTSSSCSRLQSSPVRMTTITPLTMERLPQTRPSQPSAPKQRSVYPTVEGNWEADRTCANA
ncbi:hypothetical protein OUZ56_011756 [Daphnia magna]|uniref:Uncharacterized protein n=1 Tax=Daphnia magna TaxID=35525 RepID=A0ABQ9Z145_9CRUS|nr:hypothetical protein OUZ56_011756 [Daphnia magna]